MINNILRKRVIQTLIYISVITFGAGLVFYSKETAAAATEGIRLCLDILIPYLFPFFVVSSMAVRCGLASYIGRAFRRPMRALFNVPGSTAPALALGLVSGYPVGAKTAISLYQQGLCTKTEAERLLSFCNNSGPAFILGTVGGAIFNNTAAGILLYVCHVAASLSVGVLFRFYKWKKTGDSKAEHFSATSIPLGKAFTQSITSAGSSLSSICCFVIFFSVGVRLLYLFGIIPRTAAIIGGIISPFGLDAAYAERLLSGFFEVTTGISGLVNLSTSSGASLAAAAFMLGWAGLSVHCQVLNFIGESGLSTIPYLVGKALHGVFAAIFTYFGANLLPFDAQVSKTLGGQVKTISAMDSVQSFTSAFLTVLILWLVLLIISALIHKYKSRREQNVR